MSDNVSQNGLDASRGALTPKSAPDAQGSQASSSNSKTPRSGRSPARAKTQAEAVERISGLLRSGAPSAENPHRGVDVASSKTGSSQQSTESGNLDLTPDNLGATANKPDENAPFLADGADSAGEGAGKGSDLSGMSEPEEGATPPQPQTRARNLDELAEISGLTPADLYEIEITTAGDGETVTLGKLKDAYQDRFTAQQEIATERAAMSERESESLQQQQVLNALWGDLQHHVRPETLQHFAAEADRQKARERQKMLHHMPELNDAAKMDAFRDQVIDLHKAYGFRPDEVILNDARHVLMVRDMMRDRADLKRLREFKPEPVREAPPKAVKSKGRGQRQQSRAQRIERARAGSQADKVAAISDLLQGGKRRR